MRILEADCAANIQSLKKHYPMKKKKHPVIPADNRPREKAKVAGLAEEDRAPRRRPRETKPTAPPRSIEDAETEEEELDQNRKNQKRAETK